METIIDFLGRLARNNDRAWFNAHKDEYLECKARFDVFVDSLVGEISKFDDTVGLLSAADCTYRIYRDTRFSTDKRPYKTHIGCFICRDGKKSPFAGYYFQVGPCDSGYDSGCMLAAGDYCCDRKVLNILREDIDCDKALALESAIAQAKNFTLDWDGALRRVPAGFPSHEPYSKYLRLKNFCLVNEVGVQYMLRPHLVAAVAQEFKSTKPFLDLINRAIEYVTES